MNQYRPDLNTDAYSLDWLTARAATLRKVLTGGTKAQRNSPAASAELAAINYALKHRAMTPRHPLPTADQLPAGTRSHKLNPNSPRLVLHKAPDSDVAVGPQVWQPTPANRQRQPEGAYAAAVAGVTSDYAPKKYDRYN